MMNKEAIKSNVRLLLSMPWETKVNGNAWEFMVADAYGLGHVESKLLYDVVDISSATGWSVKTISTSNVSIGGRVEPIIARADIFNRCYPDLGYYELSMDDNPKDLGNAIIRLWNQKVSKDANTLGIKHKKISVLAKSNDLAKFAYFEKDIDPYDEDKFEWSWTGDARKGLEGRIRGTDYWKFKWTPSGTQLFERWLIPREALFFDIDIVHFTTSTLKEMLGLK